ncbi:MAG TPA: TerB family tellurite resistance protein [Flavobacterium sp.]|jgi:uncharacterized membrane protein YebE (DUF533 family)
MSFSDLFDSEFKTRNKGHFSAIVRVALADDMISAEERAFLDRLAKSLDISPDEYEEILENPMKYPINPPYLNSQRIERLYDLSRMVHVEHQLGDKQDVLLHKFALALGFPPENVDAIVNKAMALVDSKVDGETFMNEMEHIQR